jgi:hypothetical protein
MIKRFRNALVFALCLPLASLALAEARPGGSSFKGGFSSQKSAAARNSAPKQPSFGSFGARKPDAAPARDDRSGTAMSRDLDRRAAQDRALRNWDSRRDAANGSAAGAAGNSSAARSSGNATPLPPLNPVQPGGRSASGTPGGSDARTAGSGGWGTGAGGSSQPSPAPVIVRERSSSNAWLWGLGGYLLGHSAISHANETAPAPTTSAPTSASPAGPAAATGPASDRGATDIDALNASADAAIAGTHGAESSVPAGGAVKAGAGGTTSAAEAAQHDRARERDTIRTLTWMLLPFGFVLLLYFGWKHMKAGKKQANYSFERT